MRDKERRSSKKFKMKEGKKYPYKKVRKQIKNKKVILT